MQAAPKHERYPTSFQRKTIWAAITTVSVVLIGTVSVGLIWLVSVVLGFLQPILIPFAIAGVMAYLLEPLVSWMERRGVPRQRAVLSVFALALLSLACILVWIIPSLYVQTGRFARSIPAYTVRVQKLVTETSKHIEERFNIRILPDFSKKSEPAATLHDDAPQSASFPQSPSGDPSRHGEPLSPQSGIIPFPPSFLTEKPSPAEHYDLQDILSGSWIGQQLPRVLSKLWSFIASSVGGFLGVFGFALSMVIVPIYLYYFLIESRNIQASWGKYLPLRASAFKDEVVSALQEINGYLIAFFRGQLVVSLINGIATGVGLMFIGLDFGLLIGLALCVLGIIPYLGIVLCWVPAVLIALAQGSSWIVPDASWWMFPLVVTIVFTIVQQIDGFFITPKVVGDSVGLHPMTVIVSVFVWSMLMGGLLGAILAVPLTATLKVLLRRYIWMTKNDPAANPTPQTAA